MTPPHTRDISRIVDALAIVEDELSFQVMRLENHVRPRTEEEREYHENLKGGYSEARRWVGLLKRYHEGRLERLRMPKERVDARGHIDAAGRATAYTEDGDE